MKLVTRPTALVPPLPHPCLVLLLPILTRATSGSDRHTVLTKTNLGGACRGQHIVKPGRLANL
eukprot:1141402-Pelagomonas_calceolata.AAC.10